MQKMTRRSSSINPNQLSLPFGGVGSSSSLLELRFYEQWKRVATCGSRAQAEALEASYGKLFIMTEGGGKKGRRFIVYAQKRG